MVKFAIMVMALSSLSGVLFHGVQFRLQELNQIERTCSHTTGIEAVEQLKPNPHEKIRCVYAVKEIRSSRPITRDCLGERIIERCEVPPGAAVSLKNVVGKGAEYNIPKNKYIFFPFSASSQSL